MTRERTYTRWVIDNGSEKEYEDREDCEMAAAEWMEEKGAETVSISEVQITTGGYQHDWSQQTEHLMTIQLYAKDYQTVIR